MGGVFGGKNNILNCSAWEKIYSELSPEEKNPDGLPQLRLAPITGAQENVGWPDEDSFYKPFIQYCASLQNPLGIEGARLALSIGDGCPDNKLLDGIEAVKALDGGRAPDSGKEEGRAFKAAVFLKPYPQEKLFRRIEWVLPVAEYLGVDIDAFNIVTMRNKVHLEKKTAAQLNELRRIAKIPFVVKGVFTREDMELVKEMKPDAALVSNHGGRVETEEGSSADFLREYIQELRKYCGAVWVDGGIRTKDDVVAAKALGADQVLLGRPLIRDFLKSRL